MPGWEDIGMKRISIVVAMVMACSGTPSADEVEENCSATHACVDGIVQMCSCCSEVWGDSDPTNGGCYDPGRMCAAALKLDSKAEPWECRSLASASCDAIEDEGGCR